jgi:hypothetical protein
MSANAWRYPSATQPHAANALASHSFIALIFLPAPASSRR